MCLANHYVAADKESAAPDVGNKDQAPAETTVSSSSPLRVLVADDHIFVREGVISLLRREPDMICCGESDTVSETLAKAVALKPDLVLLDLRLKDGEAFDLIISLKQCFPQMPVLVLSQYAERYCIHRALECGASGFLSKADAAEAIIAAMRCVLRGEVYISSSGRDELDPVLEQPPAPNWSDPQRPAGSSAPALKHHVDALS